MLARLDEIQEKLKDVLTEKPNESRTVAAHEQSDIALAKSPQAIVSLHGINTRGAWQKEFTSVLSDKGLPHKPYDYGFFHPVRFAFRRSRKAEIRRFIDYYARQGFGPGKAPSVVAHSFGSYIVCIALERNQEIYFKDIILLGSIVRRDFPWSKFTKTGRVRRVLNERAQKDVWVPRAKLVVPDAGPSGVEGFIDLAGGAVQERIHEHFDHSEVLHELRYEHVWVPFLKGETITVSPP
jgi:hypothetical protein